MLEAIQKECLNCNLCGIGRQEIGGKPSNVFSNMNPSKIVVVGQNPGWEEVQHGVPFIGISGKIFDECMEKYAGIKRSDLYICNAVNCLRYNCKVLLEDGTYKTISELVKTRYSGKVLSVSSSGEIVPQKVVGWYKNERLDRKMFKISPIGSKNSRHGSVGPILTDNHPVLTKRGYLKASDIIKSDKICIGENYPNNVLEDIIYGSILGDASITRGNFYESHCIAQKEYSLFKMKCLRDFGVKYTEYRTKGKDCCRINTLSGYYFRNLRKKFYTPKKTIFGIKHLSDLMVSVWYMDDGNLNHYKKRSPSMCFSTNGFSKEEVEYLSVLIRKHFNLSDVKVVKSNGWRIRIGYVGTEIISEKISKYILPSMRYKLPEKYREVKFVDVSLDCNAKNCCWSKGVNKYEVSVKEKSVYCIDVENTHNFITTGGVVVHNCYTPENRKPTDLEFQNCSQFLQKQIDFLKPKVVVTLGGVALRVMTGLNGITKFHAKPLYSTRYKVNVFPLLHPSPLNTNRPDKKKEFCEGIEKFRAYLDSLP